MVPLCAGDTRFDTATGERFIYNGSIWLTTKNVAYKHYNILEEDHERNGVRWFSVECSDELRDWLKDTYCAGSDYYNHRTLKGVWVDVPEQILTMIKLKW